MRYLCSGSSSEFGEIVMRGPRAWREESDRVGDELMDAAEVLLGLLALLVNNAVTAVKLRA